jgi:hypothetical protein
MVPVAILVLFSLFFMTAMLTGHWRTAMLPDVTKSLYQSAMDIFIKKRMLCVGCPAQDCHTLEDVAEIYGYARESFLRTLSKAIKNDKKP